MSRRARGGRGDRPAGASSSTAARPASREQRLARQRVGATADARARWLMDFAACNLATLPEERRGALRWELAAYLEGGRTADPEAYPADPRADPSDLLHCHEWLVAGLARLGGGRPWEIHLEFVPRYWVRLGRPRPTRRAPVVGAFVPFREVVLRDSVPILLARLRFCPRTGCGRAFLRRKRQQFCTSRCAQAERSARFRRVHPERARETRRRTYVRGMQARHGPRVRVGIRSPRAAPSEGGV